MCKNASVCKHTLLWGKNAIEPTFTQAQLPPIGPVKAKSMAFSDLNQQQDVMSSNFKKKCMSTATILQSETNRAKQKTELRSLSMMLTDYSQVNK